MIDLQLFKVENLIPSYFLVITNRENTYSYENSCQHGSEVQSLPLVKVLAVKALTNEIEDI